MKLFALALALVSTSAFALGHWEIVSQLTENATNSEQFVQLQQKYPDIFGRYDAKEVVSANISITEYEFRGETKCQAGDPRLQFKSTSYGLCTGVSENSPGGCFQTAARLPGLEDPCAE